MAQSGREPGQWPTLCMTVPCNEGKFCAEVDSAPAEKPCRTENAKPTPDWTGVYTTANIYGQTQRSHTRTSFPLSLLGRKKSHQDVQNMTSACYQRSCPCPEPPSAPGVWLCHGRFTGTEQTLSDHRLQGNRALSQPPYTLPAWLRTSSPQAGRPLTHRLPAGAQYWLLGK